MIILVNELLYQDSEEEIYKTIKGNLYGMYSSMRGVLVKPCFLHIFKFTGSLTVVVDQQEEYLEMDYNSITAPLAPEKEAEYRNYIIKNSRCNCHELSSPDLHCNMCGGYGQIVNQYGKKLVAKFLKW